MRRRECEAAVGGGGGARAERRVGGGRLGAAGWGRQVRRRARARVIHGTTPARSPCARARIGHDHYFRDHDHHLFTRTDLRDPCEEWGTSAEANDFQLAGSRASVKIDSARNSTNGHRKLVFLVHTPSPEIVTKPDFDLPLPTAASSSMSRAPEVFSSTLDSRLYDIFLLLLADLGCQGCGTCQSS